MLLSSFGAFGRLKLISNGRGELLVTKDGQEILAHAPLPEEAFSRLHIQTIERFGRQYGDGSSTLYITSRNLLKSVAPLSPSLDRSHSKMIRTRLALDVLTTCIQSSKVMIFEHMIAVKTFEYVSDYKLLATGIWRNVLAPATSCRIAAILVDILVSHSHISVSSFLLKLIIFHPIASMVWRSIFSI